MKARCSGWSLSIVPNPSSVVIAAFAATDTGTEQERADLPSSSTVQAPHWASPQPNFGPFTRNVKSAMILLRSGVLGRETKAYTSEAAGARAGAPVRPRQPFDSLA